TAQASQGGERAGQMGNNRAHAARFIIQPRGNDALSYVIDHRSQGAAGVHVHFGKALRRERQSASEEIIFLFRQQGEQRPRVGELSAQEHDDFLPPRIPRFLINQLHNGHAPSRNCEQRTPTLAVDMAGKGGGGEKLLKGEVNEEKALLRISAQQAAVLQQVL